MEIVCSNCRAKLNVPDEKLPAGKVSSLKCPKCSSKISIDLRPGSSDQPGKNGGSLFHEQEEKKSESIKDQVDKEEYDSSERPFDFLEEEEKTALICESDPDLLEHMKKTLDLMEYHISVPEGIRDALRKMKYHVYDIVLVNERFDGSDPESNGVLVYLERMTMDVRRDIYVALVTERCPTMDYMAAFLKSVNLTINPKDMRHLDRILTRGINERDYFYSIYKETARKMGKI